MQLKGKTVVLAVTGSIAAYKIVNLARMLKKMGADVQVLMTRNATEFITPLTFEELTANKCLIDTFDRNFQYNVEPLQENHFAGHESQYVSQSHCAGQSGETGPVRICDHSAGAGHACQWRQRRRTDAG